MCSLHDHMARPAYQADGDQVWQKTDSGWVNIIPGSEMETVDALESAEPIYMELVRERGIR